MLTLPQLTARTGQANYKVDVCRGMVASLLAIRNTDSEGRVIFGPTKESNLAVGAFALVIAAMLIEFLVNMEFQVQNKKMNKQLKPTHSRKPISLKSCDEQHDPIFPAFFQENAVPQVIEAEWNAQLRSGFLPSNFEENALSGFDKFRFGPDEQICSTEV